MARVKVKLDITLQDIEDAIQSAIEEAYVSNIGPDSMTEYEIDDVSVTMDDKGNLIAEVGCQHISGKWASTDEVAEQIISSMSTNINLEIEANQC